MGLTIHHEVRLARCDRASAILLVRRLHARVAKRGPTRPGVRALPVTTDPDELERWATAWMTNRRPETPDTVEGISVQPIEGCIFPVMIGEDCEPLWLGLCRYPATVRHDGRDIATRLGSGWRMSGACKTQYASLHGWDHFRRCHITAIGLLREWVVLGARVRIIDEGGWWPRRSDSVLRQALETMNQTVAALAGAVKDSSDPDEPGAVVSPIFAHPHFERLEAEGLARNGPAVSEAARLVSNLRPPGGHG